MQSIMFIHSFIRLQSAEDTILINSINDCLLVTIVRLCINGLITALTNLCFVLYPHIYKVCFLTIELFFCQVCLATRREGAYIICLISHFISVFWGWLSVCADKARYHCFIILLAAYQGAFDRSTRAAVTLPLAIVHEYLTIICIDFSISDVSFKLIPVTSLYYKQYH